MCASAGVMILGASWPDLLVALVMALLAISAARSVIQQARDELNSHRALQVSG
jgi:Co/Zn/Cd efflux system component